MQKNNFSKFLLLSSWIFGLTALLCSFLRVDVHITHETFAGLGIAFMGVMATFIVGYQIFTALEQQKRLKKIEHTYNSIIRFQNKIISELDYEKYYRRIGTGIKAQESKKHILALHYYLEALNLIIKYPDNYAHISIALNKLNDINTSNSISSDLMCDIRSINSCVYLLEKLKDESLYQITLNKELIDSLLLQLKSITNEEA